MIVLDTLLAAAGSAAALVAYLGCVALATTAQTLTGFAFGLIFLSLMAALDLASVADAANVATVLTLVNALTYLRAHRQAPPWRLMKPALASSSVGVVAGLALLNWFSTTAAQALKGLLGLAIVACALALVARGRVRADVAPPRSFALAGAVSGLMGGLFGTSGPPIVYHLYRQPLAPEVVRRCLLLMFAFNALMRLALVLPTGGFSLRALLLTSMAVPVVHLFTRLALRLQPHVPAQALRWGVAGLLVLAGSSLMAGAWR